MADLIRIWQSDCADWGSGPPDPMEEGWIASGPPSECDFVPPEILESTSIDLVVVPPCSQVRMMQVPVMTSFQAPVASPSMPIAAPNIPAVPSSPAGGASGGGGGGGAVDEGTGPSGPGTSSGPVDSGCGVPSTLRVLTDFICELTVAQEGTNLRITATYTRTFKTIEACFIRDGSSLLDQTEDEIYCEYVYPCECSSGPV